MNAPAFGAFILGCAGERITPQEARLFADARPFGFILFDRNLREVSQIRALCDELRQAAGHDAPIFIDQEGGRVQRLRPPLACEWIPPLEEAERFGTLAARALELRHLIIALELRGLGIDGNCVPCLDIAHPDTHPVLRNRCLGSDVQRVIELGHAVIRGTQRGGVLPVIKHMPGHGRATLDSHLDLPLVDASPELLEGHDFAPFRALADMPLAMSAHLVFEQIDPSPATLSPPIISLIRSKIGFDGLLMSDDISMNALCGPVHERSAAALAAGCDVVLHCNGDLAEMQAIAQTCGIMSQKAQARAVRALAFRQTPPPLDIASLRAEFEQMTANLTA